MRLDHRIILALDVTDVTRAKSIAEAVRPHVDAVKVGWPIAMAGGMRIVTDLARGGYVLADFKVADIPATNRLIVEQAVRAGAQGVICHGFPGEDSVRACVDAAGEADVFVVAEMSHPGGADFTGQHAEEFAKLAVRAGAAGIVAPATRPERIRVLRNLIGSKLILSPGVGAQGGQPTDAIAAGADAVIIGRAIYQAADPADAARTYALEVKAGKAAR